MTSYEEHLAFARAIEDIAMAARGTEYEDWNTQDLQAYAEHLMLGLAAMTDEEIARRFHAEPDPRSARDEDLTYWIAVVAGQR